MKRRQFIKGIRDESKEERNMCLKLLSILNNMEDYTPTRMQILKEMLIKLNTTDEKKKKNSLIRKKIESISDKARTYVVCRSHLIKILNKIVEKKDIYPNLIPKEYIKVGHVFVDKITGFEVIITGKVTKESIRKHFRYGKNLSPEMNRLIKNGEGMAKMINPYQNKEFAITKDELKKNYYFSRTEDVKSEDEGDQLVWWAGVR